MSWICKLFGCNCPEQVECRGLPRTQYAREFDLLHSSVPEEAAMRIYREARNHFRTVGYSADDAGIGDLDVRIVNAYGWSHIFSGLLGFMDTYYPGVEVRDMPYIPAGYELVIDVSEHQGQLTLGRFLNFKSYGIKGVFMRGAIGKGGMDAQLSPNYNYAREAGLKVGTYNIWKPEHSAESLVANMQNVYDSFVWDYPPATDFELGNEPYYTDKVLSYLQLAEREVNVKPVIYTGRWWWDPNVGHTQWAKEYRVWAAAHYTPFDRWHYPRSFKKSDLPAGWSEFDMWQFGKVPAEWFHLEERAAKYVDVNWLRKESFE